MKYNMPRYINDRRKIVLSYTITVAIIILIVFQNAYKCWMEPYERIHNRMNSLISELDSSAEDLEEKQKIINELSDKLITHKNINLKISQRKVLEPPKIIIQYDLYLEEQHSTLEKIQTEYTKQIEKLSTKANLFNQCKETAKINLPKFEKFIFKPGASNEDKFVFSSIETSINTLNQKKGMLESLAIGLTKNMYHKERILSLLKGDFSFRHNNYDAFCRGINTTLIDASANTEWFDNWQLSAINLLENSEELEKTAKSSLSDINEITGKIKELYNQFAKIKIDKKDGLFKIVDEQKSKFIAKKSDYSKKIEAANKELTNKIKIANDSNKNKIDKINNIWDEYDTFVKKEDLQNITNKIDAFNENVSVIRGDFEKTVGEVNRIINDIEAKCSEIENNRDAFNNGDNNKINKILTIINLSQEVDELLLNLDSINIDESLQNAKNSIQVLCEETDSELIALEAKLPNLEEEFEKIKAVAKEEDKIFQEINNSLTRIIEQKFDQILGEEKVHLVEKANNLKNENSHKIQNALNKIQNIKGVDGKIIKECEESLLHTKSNIQSYKETYNLFLDEIRYAIEDDKLYLYKWGEGYVVKYNNDKRKVFSDSKLSLPSTEGNKTEFECSLGMQIHSSGKHQLKIVVEKKGTDLLNYNILDKKYRANKDEDGAITDRASFGWVKIDCYFEGTKSSIWCKNKGAFSREINLGNVNFDKGIQNINLKFAFDITKKEAEDASSASFYGWQFDKLQFKVFLDNKEVNEFYYRQKVGASETIKIFFNDLM